ncbi:MAG: CapA family protein [Woeseia sp.]|nr:CapA family protein [Woeseia sp.]MBT8097970.1 CapA family protein [Woeseia sp.]NNL55379.1 CapA family protein [Woeseia sp.]
MRIFCLVSLLWLAACSAAPDAPPANPTAAPEVAEVLPPPREASVAQPVARPGKPDIRRLRVAMVGDIMLGTDFPENRLSDDDGASLLAGVTAELQAADITIGNLEGTLLDGGEPAKECRNPRACYLFRSPARYAGHLRAAGFDVLSLANNHARDFGEDGRSATMRTLEEYGILHSGREEDFARLNVHGFRIAVLAFSVTQKSNLVHDYDKAAATIKRFAADHDIVIVSFHAGAEGGDVTRIPFAEEEHFGEPRGDVVRFGRLAVDAGADLVFGHGPHVVRGMERYKDRLIAYSLGNFATYYGISVDGLKGIAPILEATLDYQGRFSEGRIYSTVQVRPGGPQLDPEQRALRLIRDLSFADFKKPGLTFADDGRLLPD